MNDAPLPQRLPTPGPREHASELTVSMRALDLFCKAGGASMGLHRAGFDVTGIDIEPQPNYPFRFVQANALEPPFDLRKFDFIWASPVCKRYTAGARARMAKGADYPDQIPAVRQLLRGHPMTAIENVMKAPLRPDMVLHGHMFGLRVIRRRKFELSWPAFGLVPPLPKGLMREGFVSLVGNGTPTGVREMGLPDYTVANCRDAIGIGWMSRAELSQAIPPAYSEYIGRAALTVIANAMAPKSVPSLSPTPARGASPQESLPESNNQSETP